MSKTFLLNWKGPHHLYCLECGVLRIWFCSKLSSELGIAGRKTWQHITLKIYPQNLTLALHSIWDIDVLYSGTYKNMS